MLNPVSEKKKQKRGKLMFLSYFAWDHKKNLQMGGHRSPQVDVVIAGDVSSHRKWLGKSRRMSEDRLIPILLDRNSPYNQWEFQDPKMEVLYHIRSYFVGIFPCNRPYIGLIHGRYLQFRILKFPLIQWLC